VKSMVTFAHLNLMDSLRITLLERMDVIFCRNVLIYFDLQARRKVIQCFYDRLGDGGYLLLGHAESLMNVTTLFRLTHLKNDLVYQKPFKKMFSRGEDMGEPPEESREESSAD